jgi:D-glycero-D-manno-heptose 1,7-bisphosphate phosphatase
MAVAWLVETSSETEYSEYPTMPEQAQWPLNNEGVWIDIRQPRPGTPGTVLFLDRDGVINRDTGYVGDPADVVLLPGAADLIATANQRNIPVAVITNQSGIARGLFSWDDFVAVMARIEELLKREKALLNAVLACPFHPDFTPEFGVRHAAWRKPGPLMIQTAADALNANLSSSWMVGDSPTDMEAAFDSGLAGGLFVGDDASAELPAGTRLATSLAALDDALRSVLVGS